MWFITETQLYPSSQEPKIGSKEAPANTESHKFSQEESDDKKTDGEEEEMSSDLLSDIPEDNLQPGTT